MRKIIICSMILALLIFYGCPSKEQGAKWGWKYQKPIRPQETFSHNAHENVLKKEGLTVLRVILWDLKLKRKRKRRGLKSQRRPFSPERRRVISAIIILRQEI